MPVIKSAIKKLRRDRKREKENNAFRKTLDARVRAAKKQKNGKAVSSAVSILDLAVKKNLMHKNRAARIKSSLSKLSKPAPKAVSKTAKSSKPSKKNTASKKK